MRRRIESGNVSAYESLLERARPERASNAKGKEKRLNRLDSAMEIETEAETEAEMEGQSRVITVAQLLVPQPSLSYESFMGEGASVLEWLCKLNSPIHVLGDELLKVAYGIDQQPTLRERLDSARWLWSHLESLDLEPLDRNAIGAALLNTRLVFEFDMAEVEARLDALASDGVGASSQADATASKARFIDLLGLARELKHLPHDDRMRLMRKVMVHLPSLAPPAREQLMAALMAQLSFMPRGNRAMAFHELMMASLQGACAGLAQAVLTAAARQLGKLAPAHVARALSYLFKCSDLYALPESCKANLLRICLRHNMAMLQGWLNVERRCGLSDPQTLVELMNAAVWLDNETRELAVPFLAAHVAQCSTARGDLRPVAYANVIRMALNLPSPHAALVFNQMLTQMEARSSAPHGVVDELPLVACACRHLGPAESLNVLVALIAQLPAEFSPRRYFATTLISEQAERLPEPMRALIRDALAHRFLAAGGK